LKNADGSIVPNAYIFTTEDYVNDPTGSYDTQDFIGIIRSVTAAISDAGGLAVSNQDGAPFDDRLVFNRINIQPPKQLRDSVTMELYQPPNNVVHDSATLLLANQGTNPLTL